MNRPSRFAFVDEGEAVRRLDIDRDTLLAFVRAKRLRSYPGVGKESFYRISDIERLAAELHPEPGSQEAAQGVGEENISTRKVFDPAYKVYVRLLADLKWYDLTDDDLAAWVRELHPDGYLRQRTNITSVIERLQRLVMLMDAAAAHWTTTDAANTPEPPTPKRAPGVRSLPMMTTPPAAPTAQPTPAPKLLTIQRAKKRDANSGANSGTKQE